MDKFGVATALCLSMQGPKQVFQKGSHSKHCVTAKKGTLQVVNVLSETFLQGLTSAVSTRWEHCKSNAKGLGCPLDAASLS